MHGLIEGASGYLVRMHRDLFSKCVAYQNLHAAYRRASSCRRFRADVLPFSFHVEHYLYTLQHELQTGSYRHGTYKEFILIDSKRRRIQVAPFRDRIVHHAVVRIIEPLYERRFIFDSYACRKERGTLRAGRRLRSFMQGVTQKYATHAYCLQCDISRYFDSVDHDILHHIISDTIQDERLLGIIEEIIRSTNTKKGIPIGNLTSQLFANIYLNELDHFIKQTLRERYYIRYMDDFLILHHSKRHLRDVEKNIKDFLEHYLSLTLHPRKVSLLPVRNGISFLGYIHFPSHVRMRGSTVRRMKKKIQKSVTAYTSGTISELQLRSSYYSAHGFLKYADTYFLRENMKQDYFSDYFEVIS